MGGAVGRVFMIIGALLGVFVAGYTGVLLSVSNQPIWSDTWALGGLFLASGLSVAVAFFVTLGTLAGRLLEPRWLALWVLVALGTLVPLVMYRAPAPGRRGAPVLAGCLVLLGGLALRIVVIFGAQM